MKGNVSKAKGSGGVYVSDGRVYAIDGAKRIEMARVYHTYGVSVDLSNSNPETAVTYIDDAVSMVAGSPEWYKAGIFKHIKPCLLKNGAVVGYLDPDNFAQLTDGTAADITSGYSGDVMIEIPKIGYRISKSRNTLTVQVTDNPGDRDFCYKAHTREEEGDRDKLYIGAFLGTENGGLRSLAGAEPLSAKSLAAFRRYAQARGAGYDLLSFYPLTLLQCLYLIMYKNLNSQAALGMGYVGGSKQEQHCMKTGATADKGMSYGTEDPMEQMKFLGMEDFWGNLRQWVDGLIVKHSGCLTAMKNFNDTGDGYTDIGTPGNYFAGYMTAPWGKSDAGFIMGSHGGSSSTYFSDFSDCATYSYTDTALAAVFGGGFVDRTEAGAFSLRTSIAPDYAGDSLGGRLMFL